MLPISPTPSQPFDGFLLSPNSKMKKLNSVILLLLFIFGVNFAHAQNLKSQKKGKLKATAIAQYSFPLCVWHPCAVELIVRLDDRKSQKSSYARVTVEYFPSLSLPNRGFPSELVDRAKKWKFKARRDSSQDAKTQKYLKIIDSDTQKDVSEETKAPAWQLLSGAKDEKIPFDEVLPYYFVESGDYKEVRE